MRLDIFCKVLTINYYIIIINCAHIDHCTLFMSMLNIKLITMRQCISRSFGNAQCCYPLYRLAGRDVVSLSRPINGDSGFVTKKSRSREKLAYDSVLRLNVSLGLSVVQIAAFCHKDCTNPESPLYKSVDTFCYLYGLLQVFDFTNCHKLCSGSVLTSWRRPLQSETYECISWMHLDSDMSMSHVRKTVSACFAALRQFRSIRRSVSRHWWRHLSSVVWTTRHWPVSLNILFGGFS